VAEPARSLTATRVRLAVVLLALAVASLVPAGPAVAVPPPVTLGDLPVPGRTEASSGSARVALVPVVGFWSRERSVSMSAIRGALAGSSARFERVVVAVADLDGLAAQLGVVPGPTTTAATPAAAVRAARDGRRTLGLVPAGAVRPTVRALGIGRATLFGNARERTLDDWPLTVPDAVAGGPDGFDPAATWTLVAGGDVMLDREVQRHAVTLGKGPRYPWQGGLARVESRTCCTPYGGPWIVARRVRDNGAVRALLRAADIAIVNHEGPAPDRHRYHPSGFVFTFDPALLVGLRWAGIDIVSLANNHIRNAGSRGVTQTIRNLRRVGIRSVGAGRDVAAARRGECVDVRGTRACFLGYNGVDMARNAATATRPGAASLGAAVVRADIARLRREGADAVIVVPHWGPEYVDPPTFAQRRMARVMANAGADLVLGAHSHVVGGIGHLGRTPVVYSMGNLLFDLIRFERTLQGVLVEVTFAGGRPVQLELHPTVLVARSQVNLLDPDGDGRAVLERIRRASR
jgi:hypothetical protein